MKYIIDTHIFLWLLFEPEKIDTTKLEILENPENSIYITSINFWEISLKFGLGKLELNGLKPDDLPDCAFKMGLKILDIDSKNMASFHQLKRVEKHKDPFDRLIIWYCINNNFILVSKDGKFSEYSSLGLKVI
jgi:PIN domain nuclease of toxin-antitoxin system